MLVDSQALVSPSLDPTQLSDVDPVTLQIVANALGAIADEMATTIFRTAHSTVVRDSMDFSASVCNHVGLQVAQSEELLDELWGHMVQDRFTWTQEWQVADLVWWDNRCAMHRRDAFDPATRRLMHRTQLKGTKPV